MSSHHFEDATDRWNENQKKTEFYFHINCNLFIATFFGSLEENKKNNENNLLQISMVQYFKAKMETGRSCGKFEGTKIDSRCIA